MVKVYISTAGFVYDSWKSPTVFYPEGMCILDYLEFYASKFNSLTVTSTFVGQSCTFSKMYETWAKKVAKNESFKFVILAPKAFTHGTTSILKMKSIWNDFWATGDADTADKKEGCEVLHTAGKLGCVVLQFPSKFLCDEKNMARLERMYKILPKAVRFSFDFRHWSWWERSGGGEEHPSGAEVFSRGKDNVCISTPYVENGLVDFGWAGNLPSTRVFAKKSKVPIFDGDSGASFAHITFNGSFGAGIGSYDNHDFLERTAAMLANLKGVGEVFCSFNNTSSSFCFPLPGLEISGLFLHPQISELPFYAEVDRPGCLHDALRLGDILEKNMKSKYKIGEDGYVEIEFS